jgi:hypothetical protein
MTVNNNLNSMASSEVQLNQMASNLSQISDEIADPQLQEVTGDIIDSIVGQIPEIISYSANAKSIETQNAVSDMLLNIKA